MHILVTGGCGFIGSHFIRHLIQKYPDHRITNLDALTYAAHPETVGELAELAPDRYRFIQGNIASPAIADIFVQDVPHAIVNFAAETHVDRSILDPMAFVQTNVVGTQNLLTWARKIGDIRMLHVSTDEVYGTLPANVKPVNETAHLSPNSPYAASKAAADLLVLASCRTYKQNAVISRCSNNFGPYQYPEKLLPLVIANALEGMPIPVYGDGQQIRDWIHVQDHCEALDLILQGGKAGEVYNISAFGECRNLDLIKKVLQLMNAPTDLITFVGDRPAHDRRYALDSNKIQRDLGWKPRMKFEEGLLKTIQWYLDRKPWWKQLRDKKFYEYYEANYKDKFKANAKEENTQPGGRV